jgi:hypothetical protein
MLLFSLKPSLRSWVHINLFSKPYSLGSVHINLFLNLTPLKKNYRKEKSPYSDLFLVIADQPPPKQYQKSIISKNDVSKKGFSPCKFRH